MAAIGRLVTKGYESGPRSRTSGVYRIDNDRGDSAIPAQQEDQRLAVLSANIVDARRSMSAADPLASLLAEHQLIVQGVRILDTLALAAEGDEPIDAGVLQNLIVFLTEFVDVIHHEKEECLLMPALYRAGVDWNSESMSKLRNEHDQERYLVTALHHLAHQLPKWSLHGRLHFVSLAREFASLQRKHLLTEETELYPLARQRLDPRSLNQLEGDLQSHDASFEPERKRLLALLQEIAPFGSPPASLYVESLMQTPVYGVAAWSSIFDALNLAEQHGIHHLPVVIGRRVVGIVCTCDLEELPLSASVVTAMQAPIVRIDWDASAEFAAKLMADSKVGSLLVMDGESVAGILTRQDLEQTKRPELCPAAARCSGCASYSHLRYPIDGLPLCVECLADRKPPDEGHELGGSG